MGKKKNDSDKKKIIKNTEIKESDNDDLPPLFMMKRVETPDFDNISPKYLKGKMKFGDFERQWSIEEETDTNNAEKFKNNTYIASRLYDRQTRSQRKVWTQDSHSDAAKNVWDHWDP